MLAAERIRMHLANSEGFRVGLPRILAGNSMLHFTRQQQLVLCVALFLMLTGWAVKAWRLSQRPAPATSATSK
jgi:hypothetical protein